MLPKLLVKPSDAGLTWILNVDGASNLQGNEVGLILTNSEVVVAKQALHFLLKAINQSEYKALFAGLKLAKVLEVQCLRVFTDLARR